MIRLILVFLVILLLVRAFVITGLESRTADNSKGKSSREPWKFKKGIPKWLGEYTDFEEIGGRKK